ncbi:MAG: alcohol dehydrogenase catalytic domain-containing protein [Candidatus Lariskella arthropodorum]
MKCAYIKDYDICLGRAPLPIPEAEEILIKVEAIGLNRADILQVQGMYQSRESFSSESKLEIPGLEVSGFCMKTGKRVMALLKKGGQAEYVPAHRSMVFEIPEAIVTIWLSLYKLGKLEVPSIERLTRHQQLNGSVLIHGGSSGVGILAVQFALASPFVQR